MALKFRRGTTAQQSGSLAFGEPYVNTTLGTLLIGGPDGDIVLGTSGTGSTGNFGAISGSGLDITGNANIAGNLTLGGAITIGDATADTVNVVASLSSSLIPQTTNAFDLGSPTKEWRNLHASTANFSGNVNITGSLVTSGSKVEFNVVWPDANSEQHIVKTNGFTLDGRTYNYAAIALEHYEDSPGILHNAIATYMFDPTYQYGSETLVGPYRAHMQIFPSGSGGHVANMSVADLKNGKTQALIYADYVQLGAYAGESIVIGNSGSVVQISGSVRGNITGSIAATNGVVSASAQIDITSTTGYSTFSSSLVTRDAAQDVLISSLQSNILSASVFNTFSTSVDSRLDSVELVSASAASALNSVSGAVATTISNLGSTYATDAELTTLSSSVDSRIDILEAETAALESFTSSINTTIKDKLNSEGVISGSSQLTSSYDSRYLTLSGDQSIGGTKTFNNLVVNGTGSFAYIQSTTGSSTSIGEAFIVLNENTPSSNYAGIKVVDSGSSFTTASFLYDGYNNQWVFEKAVNGGNPDTSIAIFGPISNDGLGTEFGLTQNKVPKAVSTHGHHIADSNITDTGTLITLGSNTSVVGTLVATGTSLVSASAQIDITSTTGYSTFSSSLATRNAGQDTTITTLSSSVNSRLLAVEAVSQSAASALNSFSASNAATDATQTTNISTATAAAAGAFASASAYSASAAVVDAGQDTLISSLRTNILSASVFTTFSTSVDSRLDVVEGVSASAASALNSVSGAFATTIGNLGSNYATDAELSSLSSSVATRNAGQDTTITTLSSSVASRLGTLETKDITITLTGDVTGTGTITDLANVSFATTIAANSVALGTDTTGNYVASLVAGTGVTLSNNSGENATPTIAIGQAVATSSNVQFNSLGVGMAASATAGRIDATNDVVAFSSSDIRFKENIKAIENPIQKIRQISGNTYDWKEENKIEHGYEGNDVGVIAQEIEAVLPQLVQTRESGYKAVKYDKLVALLIEGIKEQQIQIDNLTIQVEELKKQKGL
jgi:uncharacterized coiled-coil protein SlyX